MNPRVAYCIAFCLAQFLVSTVGFSAITTQPGLKGNPSGKGFVNSKDVFGTRVFIENNGQYDNIIPGSPEVLFVYDDRGEKIFFTSRGLVYQMHKQAMLSEEELEELNEKGLGEPAPKSYFVYMNWQGSNPSVVLESSLKQSHYFTFGEAKYNSATYKKIVYKNLYDNIDVEYTVPENKPGGIKYSVILHPGANPNDVKMLYSGDMSKIRPSDNGDVIIKTAVRDITEHAPLSFYAKGDTVSSAFVVEKNSLSFSFPNGYQANETLIVDPWVTAVTTLSVNNNAYDVDYDASGNIFVYGGNITTGTGRCKVAKYDPNGILQWTFSGLLITPVWNSGSSWTSNFKVERGTGKTYIGRNNGSPGIIRIDASGNYDNFISTNGTVTQAAEVWNIEFNCAGDLMVFTGATYSFEKVDKNTSIVLQLSTFNPTVTGCCQDIVATAFDDLTGNTFVYNLGHTALSNKISMVNPTFSNTTWISPSGFATFVYLQNKNSYQGGAASNGPAVAFNALALNTNYLYYYDGANIAAYDKTTGTMLGTILIPGLVGRTQGGIAVDDCDNVYVGGNGSILCYNFNGTTFTFVNSIPLNATSTFQNVYDVKLDRFTNTLFACGSGFVGIYSAISSSACPIVSYCTCNTPVLSVNTTSMACGNIGTSSVSMSGVPGPFTYSWQPGGQTSSVVTGLNPGTYTVSVYSSSCNVTSTATTVFSSALPPYSVAVTSTSITCANLGSATVAASNMPGPFSYTWLPTAHTGSTDTGLSPGTYSILVYSAGCNFNFSTTTNFVSLIPLTGSLHITPSLTCNGASNGTANYTGISGGSPNQNYLWTNGTASLTNAAPNTLSAGLWSVTVTDALTGCAINDVFYISEPPALTVNIGASSATACVGTPVSFTATTTGGTSGYTYSWQGGPAAATYSLVHNTAGAYTHSVLSQDAYSCSVSGTVAVNYIANPTITIANASICPLQTGTLQASGASTYTWSNSTSGSFLTDNPPASKQYSVIGSALGCSATASGSIILKPIPNPVFYSNSPVCNGQALTFSAQGGVSYLWTGPLSFTSNAQNSSVSNAAPANSGSYNLTLTAANSCTNSATYNLTVNPTPPLSATGATVCEGQAYNLGASSVVGGSFYWTGPGFQTPAFVQNPGGVSIASASGNYTVKATSAQGCTNSAIANVTVTAPPLVYAANTGPKCLGGNVILNAPSFAGPYSYNWSGPGGYTSALQNPTVTNLSLSQSGNYFVAVTLGPCVRSASTQVVVNPLPSPTIITQGRVCEQEKLSLTVSNSTNNLVAYSWSGPVGFISQALAPSRDSCKVGFSGLYSVLVTDANSCQASASLAVTIYSNPVVVASGATVCINDDAVLKATGADSYAWYNKGVGLSSAANLYINPATNPVGKPEAYTVMGTAANGCTAWATASVTTLKLPAAQARVEPSNRQCAGSVFKFIGGGGAYYAWAGPGNIKFQGQEAEVTAVNNAYQGTYTLLVVDAFGCKSGTVVSIAISDAPGGYIKMEKSGVCVPFCADFKFVPAAGSGSIVNQYWTLAEKSFTQDAFSFCFKKSGNFEVTGTVTDENNCSGKINYLVNAYPVPFADFINTPEVPVENEDEVVFMNQSKGEGLKEFSWHFINNANVSYQQSPTFIFKDQGIYPVALVVKNEWGCSDSVVKTIKVDPQFNFFVPNTFTPNEDNKNELFMPVTRAVRLYSFSVFNRWGQLLFETKDLEQGWNGTYNGSPCKEDIYVWKATVSTVAGDAKEFKGHVTLIR